MYGDIERRYGFIADQQIRIERQSTSDANALTLSARKTVGISRQKTRIQTNVLHQFLNDLHALIAVTDPVND